jgi:ribose 5-phosphate isomerase A
MSADDQKRISGEAAAELVEAGMVVGLGTGSTAAWFVKALAARKLDIRGVPTSEATANLARELGIPLAALDDVKSIDLTVDGADEVGPGLSLIKGGGAALLREKLVWEASKRCVVIADAAKKVDAWASSRCRSRSCASATSTPAIAWPTSPPSSSCCRRACAWPTGASWSPTAAT